MKFKFTSILILSLIFITLQSSAQIGIDVNYGFNKYDDFNDVFSKQTDVDLIFKNSYRFGVDYWFKPIPQRMEMTAGINYSQMKNDFKLNTTSAGSASLKEIQLNVKNNFYMFDFEEPCNCPTFNKSGEMFKKGFFLQTVLGASYQLYDISHQIDGISDSNNIAYHVGAGAGFDYGVSSLLTITPYFNYIYGFSNQFDGLSSLQNDIDTTIKSSKSSINVGVRFGFRADHKKW